MVPLEVGVESSRASLMLISIFMPLASRIWLPAVDAEMLVKCLVAICHSISGVTPNDRRGLILDLTCHRFGDFVVSDVTDVQLGSDQPRDDERDHDDADQQDG